MCTQGSRVTDGSTLAAHVGPSVLPAADGPTVLPTVVIQANRGLWNLDLYALWEFRELVYFIVWRDLKTRYKQSALGVSWALVQPFVTMLIFTVVFAHFARMPSDGLPYPLFALTALLPWTYLSQAISRSGSGLVSNANLISKVYFPRLVIPLAGVATPLVDFMVAFALLLAMMVWYGTALSAFVLLLPLFVLMALVTALSISLWLSALHVRYRDVGHVIPFLLQIWMYASPVAYPVSLVPPRWQAVYALNPMVTVIEGFRWCLLGAPRPNLEGAAMSSAGVVALLLGGLLYFRATERTFADLI